MNRFLPFFSFFVTTWHRLNFKDDFKGLLRTPILYANVTFRPAKKIIRGWVGLYASLPNLRKFLSFYYMKNILYVSWTDPNSILQLSILLPCLTQILLQCIFCNCREIIFVKIFFAFIKTFHFKLKNNEIISNIICFLIFYTS